MTKPSAMKKNQQKLERFKMPRSQQIQRFNAAEVEELKSSSTQEVFELVPPPNPAPYVMSIKFSKSLKEKLVEASKTNVPLKMKFGAQKNSNVIQVGDSEFVFSAHAESLCDSYVTLKNKGKGKETKTMNQVGQVRKKVQVMVPIHEAAQLLGKRRLVDAEKQTRKVVVLDGPIGTKGGKMPGKFGPVGGNNRKNLPKQKPVSQFSSHNDPTVEKKPQQPKIPPEELKALIISILAKHPNGLITRDLEAATDHKFPQMSAIVKSVADFRPPGVYKVKSIFLPDPPKGIPQTTKDNSAPLENTPEAKPEEIVSKSVESPKVEAKIPSKSVLKAAEKAKEQKQVQKLTKSSKAVDSESSSDSESDSESLSESGSSSGHSEDLGDINIDILEESDGEGGKKVQPKGRGNSTIDLVEKERKSGKIEGSIKAVDKEKEEMKEDSEDSEVDEMDLDIDEAIIEGFKGSGEKHVETEAKKLVEENLALAFGEEDGEIDARNSPDEMVSGVLESRTKSPGEPQEKQEKITEIGANSGDLEGNSEPNSEVREEIKEEIKEQEKDEPMELISQGGVNTVPTLATNGVDHGSSGSDQSSDFGAHKGIENGFSVGERANGRAENLQEDSVSARILRRWKAHIKQFKVPTGIFHKQKPVIYGSIVTARQAILYRDEFEKTYKLSSRIRNLVEKIRLKFIQLERDIRESQNQWLRKALTKLYEESCKLMFPDYKKAQRLYRRLEKEKKLLKAHLMAYYKLDIEETNNISKTSPKRVE